ncbi:stationary-phase survival protein SurE [Gloeothece citriformis PCC 7424]|uniref:5'-nucleotidase SurE n=1 Tax=Gloeothece citriformis (strain PCC 7424) TaxID=65393 RepID=SURE_GLOC7|nr:5'/3'-nucleotidase SurE [Gloeothece citriformis]B7KB74.1 RecName: Full=5'-nucleotidase SurE; AltName: Full=Nucleoside 5'-monophosphate phosphohydrolase [Gloeothece citriformis PCC 7424]ACK71430.1 stationary-phase survival protein SurE [Gloeothece citriformis PCC 7424]
MTTEKPLNLLISNDDGIFALGVRTLANTLAKAGHQVTVVCPDRERSATGHGLTLHQPIRAQIVEGIFDPQVTAWSCSGTPSDCIKFALSAVLFTRPDFVLSGINHGSNLGTDILYSGTVSAAMEGLIDGITSIALSLTSFSSQDFQPAANFAVDLIAKLARHPLPQPTLLNVNVPPVKSEDMAGVKLTRQGLRRYRENFEKRLDPRGKSYYWLVGEVIEEIEQPDHLHLPGHIPTDVQAIGDNYITITPLQYNLTDVQGFSDLNQTQWFDP